jgi:hypothetical protein
VFVANGLNILLLQAAVLLMMIMLMMMCVIHMGRGDINVLHLHHIRIQPQVNLE